MPLTDKDARTRYQNDYYHRRRAADPTYAQATYDDRRRSNLKRRFGITLEQYTDKHTAQRGLCAICGTPETRVIHGKVQPLSVDHDHATNAIRDLLCHSCNTGLGSFRDDPARLEAACAYLRRHKGDQL